MNVDRNLKNNKTGLLAYFRSRANEIVSELTLQYSAADYKKKASALNKAIIQSRDKIYYLFLKKQQELKTGQIEKFLNVFL